MLGWGDRVDTRCTSIHVATFTIMYTEERLRRPQQANMVVDVGKPKPRAETGFAAYLHDIAIEGAELSMSSKVTEDAVKNRELLKVSTYSRPFTLVSVIDDA